MKWCGCGAHESGSHRAQGTIGHPEFKLVPWDRAWHVGRNMNAFVMSNLMSAATSFSARRTQYERVALCATDGKPNRLFFALPSRFSFIVLPPGIAMDQKTSLIQSTSYCGSGQRSEAVAQGNRGRGGKGGRSRYSAATTREPIAGRVVQPFPGTPPVP